MQEVDARLERVEHRRADEGQRLGLVRHHLNDLAVDDAHQLLVACRRRRVAKRLHIGIVFRLAQTRVDPGGAHGAQGRLEVLQLLVRGPERVERLGLRAHHCVYLRIVARRGGFGEVLLRLIQPRLVGADLTEPLAIAQLERLCEGVQVLGGLGLEGLSCRLLDTDELIVEERIVARGVGVIVAPAALT